MRAVRLFSLLLAWLLAAPAFGKSASGVHRDEGRAKTVRTTLVPLRSSRIVSPKSFAPTGRTKNVQALPLGTKDSLAPLGPLAAFAPHEMRAQALPLAMFKQLKTEIGFDLAEQTVGVTGPVQIDLSLPVLDYARTAVERTRGRDVKTVLVPMAGHDAGSAVRLFPEAQTIIGVDAQPFLKRARAGKQLAFGALRSQNYTHWQQIDAMGHLAPALLSSLAWAVPGFRLRGVTLLEHPDEKGAMASSAVIEFDAGEGTPTRRYIHVNDWFPNATPKGRGPWWWRALDAHRPDAVVVKGSQDWSRYASTAGVRQQLRTWLSGGGVLVEGDGEFTTDELAPAEASRLDAEAVPHARVIEPRLTTKLDDVRFGYGGLRATGF